MARVANSRQPREFKDDKKKEAQKVVDEFKGNKDSRKFRKLESKLKKAEGAYNSTKDKMNLVDKTMEDLCNNNRDLYDRIENLKDPFEKVISVYIYVETNLNTRPFSQINTPGFDSPSNLDGITEAKSFGKIMTFSDFKHKTTETVIGITSDDGLNTIRITLNRSSDLGFTLSHECGHAFYLAKHMYQYMEWMFANPFKVEIGGHGVGDPSGAEAKKEEVIYLKNKKGIE